MTFVKITKEQSRMLRAYGNIGKTQDGHTMIHIPYFFRVTDQEDVYEIISLDDMSDETLEKFIRDNRDRIN